MRDIRTLTVLISSYASITLASVPYTSANGGFTLDIPDGFEVAVGEHSVSVQNIKDRLEGVGLFYGDPLDAGMYEGLVTGYPKTGEFKDLRLYYLAEQRERTAVGVTETVLSKSNTSQMNIDWGFFFLEDRPGSEYLLIYGVFRKYQPRDRVIVFYGYGLNDAKGLSPGKNVIDILNSFRALD